ncbi:MULTISPECIES: hypothetical protein [unclassified Cryobacterium]|uniref:hypothetical protein n=1 Tax=unclassified Cryobacterium TaxID=2649013 RepID=UPI00141B6791|nr:MULTISPECIES: hypothetical protein [unclassified Cryobacterium]
MNSNSYVSTTTRIDGIGGYVTLTSPQAAEATGYVSHAEPRSRVGRFISDAPRVSPIRA